jgi:MoaA/NifB/PqqE/SkfB family radical SAM enzyme
MKTTHATRVFTERIARKRTEMGFPHKTLFEVTYRCNLACRHCYVAQKSRRREISSSDAAELFGQLAVNGCFHIMLTGGEPLLRNDMLSLIECAKREGLFVHLFTNATRITPRIADRLKELELTSLEISLHSLKKDRFDWFTRVDGSFDRVMKAIRLLREREVDIVFKIAVTAANVDEIEAMGSFARSVNARCEWTPFLVPKLDTSKENLLLRLKPGEIERVQARLGQMFLSDRCVPERRGTEEIPVSGDSPPPPPTPHSHLFWCGAGTRGFSIDPYGMLKPCSLLPASGYSALNGGLRKAFIRLQGHARSVEEKAEYRCVQCDKKELCVSCTAKNYLECGTVTGCPDYYRTLAELSYAKSRV